MGLGLLAQAVGLPLPPPYTPPLASVELKTQYAEELGPPEERASAKRFRRWVEGGGGRIAPSRRPSKPRIPPPLTLCDVRREQPACWDLGGRLASRRVPRHLEEPFSVGFRSLRGVPENAVVEIALVGQV